MNWGVMVSLRLAWCVYDGRTPACCQTCFGLSKDLTRNEAKIRCKSNPDPSGFLQGCICEFLLSLSYRNPKPQTLSPGPSLRDHFRALDFHSGVTSSLGGHFGSLLGLGPSLRDHFRALDLHFGVTSGLWTFTWGSLWGHFWAFGLHFGSKP